MTAIGFIVGPSAGVRAHAGQALRRGNPRHCGDHVTRSCQDDGVHDYAASYPSLRFADLGDGVLEVTMSAPGRLNAVGHEGHRELAEVWTTIDRDPDVRVAIIRGEG